MNERSLPRRIATSIVDALKSQGHILVVKGGATALTRELDELMAPAIAKITPRLGPRSVVGEVTSTFGDEAADEAVEEMVAAVTRALMDSDHVEDVFAEDNVIRRDVFRAARDELMTAAEADVAEEDGLAVRVPLDTLGYVAKAVSQRADEATLREALSRAADVADAELVAYESRTREATFGIDDDLADARLELEEAIAEELADLVETGLVELPTIERRVEIGRVLATTELKAARAKLDRVGQKTLLSTGCAASWELDGNAAIKVAFTPLSDSDARDVDRIVSGFAVMAREALEQASVEESAPRPRAAPAEEEALHEAPSTKAKKVSSRSPSSKSLGMDMPTAPPPSPGRPPSGAKAKPASLKPASVKRPEVEPKPPSKAPAKTAAKAASKTAAKAPAKAATKKVAAKKAAAKKK